MLCYDIKARATITDVLNSEWLKDEVSKLRIKYANDAQVKPAVTLRQDSGVCA